MPKVTMDAEMQEFASSVLVSIEQAKRGEGRVTTPEQIAARRATRACLQTRRMKRNVPSDR